MSRKPRKPDLKALEHIPAVREALRYVGLELYIRPLGSVATGKVDAATSGPRASPALVAAPPPQPWQDEDVDAALKEEQSRGPPKPLHQLPAGQRRAIESGLLDATGMRAEKMAQFNGSAEEAASSEPIGGVPEAR